MALEYETDVKEQLLDELKRLRARVAELEGREASRAATQAGVSDAAIFLQTLIDTIPNPIFYKNTDGLYLGCNKAFEGYLGLSKDRIVGKSVYDVAPAYLADKYRAMDQALFDRPHIQVYEASVIYADGSKHDVIFNKAPLLDVQGALMGLVGVILDITERKRAEKALSDGERLIRSTLNSLSAHIAILDADGVILDTNSAWRAYAWANGLADYDFIGVHYLSVCDKAQGSEALTASLAARGIRDVIAGGDEEFTMEYPCYSPDEQRWFCMRVTRFTGDPSDPVRAVVAHEDITDRKMAEEALLRAQNGLEKRVMERTAELAEANRELQIEIAEHQHAKEKIVQQNQFMNHVIESLTHPFYVLDANDYTIKMANSAAAPTGLAPNTTCYALTHKRALPCSGSEHSCPLQMVKTGKKPVTTEHIHYDGDGNARNVEVHAYPIFDVEGNVAQIIEYSLDITERKRLEEALRGNAEKIKLFAYSVSHDLKSPLIGINGLTRLLVKQYREALDERGRRYCDQILKASEQVVALIEEINVYIRTKETPLRFENIDPKEILEMIRDEFGALLDTRQIVWSEPESIPEIKADRLSLLRVFRNLVDNALKYGGEGLSEIAVDYEETDVLRIFSLRDDGAGIGEEDCEKIFGLFQRKNKAEEVEGTGLGLAIVREIAKKHGGEVWAEPAYPRGLIFYISISKKL